MGYLLNKTGKRVMLNVLANADVSMLGVQIGNSRIIPMQDSELSAIVMRAYGDNMRYHLLHTLFKYHVLKTKDDGINEPLIVMETVEETDTPTNYKRILDLLKLYKSSDVFSCYTTFYQFKSDRLTHGGAVEMILPEHPIYWPHKPYEMFGNEQEQFGQWYRSHMGIFDSHNNEKYKQIVRMYLDAFMMNSTELSFVILSVILEMLFGAPNGELTYRISRGTALFLSTNRDEMQSIHTQVKKLYSLRSKYVHEGKHIEVEKLFELREIVRKIIICMYKARMNVSGFDFKKFTEELTFDGYVQEAIAIAAQNT